VVVGIITEPVTRSDDQGPVKKKRNQNSQAHIPEVPQVYPGTPRRRPDALA
jgi:hypothetical protein